ncbi:hypothetical protein C8R44DRAFT_792840 [Mycena epipterygia]|nr:hypothetical protein C8R44DRAFT_792840 [Mycena epipterygia]
MERDTFTTFRVNASPFSNKRSHPIEAMDLPMRKKTKTMESTNAGLQPVQEHDSPTGQPQASQVQGGMAVAEEEEEGEEEQFPQSHAVEKSNTYCGEEEEEEEEEEQLPQSRTAEKSKPRGKRHTIQRQRATSTKVHVQKQVPIYQKGGASFVKIPGTSNGVMQLPNAIEDLGSTIATMIAQVAVGSQQVVAAQYESFGNAVEQVRDLRNKNHELESKNQKYEREVRALRNENNKLLCDTMSHRESIKDMERLILSQQAKIDAGDTELSNWKDTAGQAHEVYLMKSKEAETSLELLQDSRRDNDELREQLRKAEAMVVEKDNKLVKHRTYLASVQTGMAGFLARVEDG